jgi:DNA-directed RNA polymerase subunit RPC12/RpoP
MEFKKSYYLISHRKNMHELKSNICDVCGSTWASEKILKQHKRIVHSVRSFKCDCGATFKSSTALKGHQKTHKSRELECFHCRKKFSSIPGIDRHMARHMVATEKSHKCAFCEKTFRLFVDKRDHERGHQRKI